MKNRIIKINEITDIDTSKISIYDLNNRYIDPNGTMYGLKYNRAEKKVRIIKLIRTHVSDVSQVHQEIIKNKTIQNVKEDSNYENFDDLDEFSDKTDDYKSRIFDPDKIIDEIISLMETHQDRIEGIIKSINISNIFPRENKSENQELQDIFRNIEIDGVQKFNDVFNFYKELSNYPRSLTYYLSKIEKEGREVVEQLPNETSKVMRFIKRFESISTIHDFYTNLFNLLKKLDDFIHSSSDISSDISSDNFSGGQNFLTDAKISIKTTLDEINEIIQKMTWSKSQLLNPEFYMTG